MKASTSRRGRCFSASIRTQFQIALDNAKANLGQTRLTLLSMRTTIGACCSDIAAQQSQVALDQLTFNRYAALLQLNSIAQAQFDQARFTLQTAQSTLVSLKDRAQTFSSPSWAATSPFRSNICRNISRPQSQVDEMQRQLDHAVVRAPFDGIVTEVDSLQPGTLVISALSAFTTTSAVGLVATQQCLGRSEHEGNRSHPCA